MIKTIRTEHNYCYLNKEERIIEIKKLLKEEIDRISLQHQQQQEEQQIHSSRNCIRNRDQQQQHQQQQHNDCDTSLIDMDISPVCIERKPIGIRSMVRETIKNAIKFKKSLAPKSLNKRIIFVGNISKNYRKHCIRKLFSRFGDIRSVTMCGKQYR